VHLSSNIYSGAYTENGPDMMLVSNDGWEIYGGVVPSVFETQATSWTSGNHPVGMLLMDGPNVKNGEFSEQSILDITPTILDMTGCAVPTDMDGKPIQDVFTDSRAKYETREPLSTNKSPETHDTDELEQRLEDLGYLE